VDEKNGQIAHRRMVAGREILSNQESDLGSADGNLCLANQIVSTEGFTPSSCAQTVPNILTQHVQDGTESASGFHASA
jgi:hypothetical protein